SGATSTSTPTPTPTTAPVNWVTTPKAGAEDVSVDTRVSARTEDGTLTKASLSYVSKKGNKVPVEGWLESGTWTSSDLLEPGVKYTFSLTATDESGEQQTTKRSFSTAALTLDDQIWTKVYPAGGTVGIGMPVIATFDLPVVDRASFEKHMKVTSQPAQEGSWYWLSDREAHWRPQNYWKPGTKVHVEANLNGVPAGGGRFGEQSVVTDFTVGRSVIAKVNLKTHMMDVVINGKKAKSIPVSGGRPGWETRSGVKVIMEKFTDFTMKAESIGLKEGDKDYYHDVKVKRALRITHSGEFLHSAPWSVRQQGHENVSHGCVGMSDANSIWLYDNMRVGDVVETVGSKKPMTMGNGYADWNLNWATWLQGSAL
ncbi:MAG TPA: Ig-like domain-containing protein, partial [Intrasporangium sp.]|nr:Ig-like domain-containing protein [Intrasporangium sp.]